MKGFYSVGTLIALVLAACGEKGPTVQPGPAAGVGTVQGSVTTGDDDLGMGPQARSAYDDFSAGYIDPGKWLVTPICSSHGYDCAREVRNNHLRLAVRAYGGAESDNGVSFDGSQLFFRNSEGIQAISIRLRVKSFGSATCPSNSEAAHPQLLIFGTFFNAGTGDPLDDVIAYLQVERRTDDASLGPKSLRIGGFMFTHGSFFDNVDLGPIDVDETATVTLKWDRLNHDFIVRAVKALTTPSVVEATMPYSQADVTPPVQGFKGLQVGTFSPNCTSARSFASMDASIDNVRLNAAAN